MSIRSNLKLLIAQENVNRAKAGKPALTMRRLASDTGLTLSSLSALATGQSQRIDYKTIDKLCAYFDVGVGDLLERVPDESKNERQHESKNERQPSEQT